MFLNLGASFLINCIKLLFVFKKVFLSFFDFFILRILKSISKFFFYGFVVKFYKYYRTVKKFLGISEIQSNLAVFLISRKFVHVLMVFMTIVSITVNSIPDTKAGTLSDRAHNTMLAGLIKTDFSVYDENDQLIFEEFDRTNVAVSAQKNYLDSSGSFKAQPRVGLEDIEKFEGSVIVTDGKMVKPSISSTEVTKKQRKDKIKYIIEPGDTISTIARRFEVSVNTILWENNLSSYSVIRPGKELVILPISGLSYSVKSGDTLSRIATKYDVEESEIMKANKIASAGSLKIGQELLLPGGRKIVVASKPVEKTYTGISAIKNIVKPSSQKVAGNKMAWPTPGSLITQYYSWRHKGLDIADKSGTPLYAADSGTVTRARVGRGYGYYVLIDHGGGKQTRYAHCSKFYVKEGDKVDKGQTIAAMGSTGWSTGPHIHFEVIINGVQYNPLNYIK